MKTGIFLKRLRDTSQREILFPLSPRFAYAVFLFTQYIQKIYHIHYVGLKEII